MSLTRPTQFRFARALLLAGVALSVAACADDKSPWGSLRAAAGNEQGAGANILLRTARSARDSGDLSNAVTLYKNAYELAPGRADIAAELGQTLTALGANNEAAEVYRDALANNPKNVDALRGLGNALISLNQPRLALEQFQAALALKPDPRVYNSMGVAHDMSGENQTAQASYRSGLTLAANDTSLRNNLALSMAVAAKICVSCVVEIEVDCDTRSATVTDKRSSFCCNSV